ncbi:MAG: Fis family transcriptional regulator [Sideroxydans sp.]|nr:Fis family transcriptional regulator [Sideroxydans sp.]
MLETRAIVVQLEGTEAIVESRQGGGCGHCDSEKGCGSGKLAQLFCTQPRRFRVRNGINARIGEEVQVAIADGVLLRGALTMYFLPLLLALGGGMVGTSWAHSAASSDAYAAGGVVLGLVTGFLLVRLLALRRSSSAVPPVITRCG